MNKNKITLRVSKPARQARALAAHMEHCNDAIEQDAVWFFNTPEFMKLSIQSRKKMASRLIELADAAEAAEHNRVLEAADDEAPRRARDDAFDALYQGLSQSKLYLNSGFGVGSAERYGIIGVLHRRPDDLLSLGKNVLSMLKANPQQGLGHFGGSTNTALIVTALEPLLSTLDATLQEVAKEANEYQDALNLLDDALNQPLLATSSMAKTHIAMLTITKREDLIRSARAIRKTRSSSATATQDDTNTPQDNTNTPQDNTTLPTS